MYKLNDIYACKTEKELFQLWKTKDKYDTYFVESNTKIEITINHRNVFIEDGIINPEIWKDKTSGKHILFMSETKDYIWGNELDLFNPKYLNFKYKDLIPSSEKIKLNKGSVYIIL